MADDTGIRDRGMAMPSSISTTRFPALWVSLRVGFGWAFLMLLSEGVERFWSLSPSEQLSDASVMLLMFLGSYVVLEDLFERLKSLVSISDENHEHEIPASWRAVAIAMVVFLASASHSLLHGILGELVVHQGIFETVRILLYSYILFAFCILWVWIRGAGHEPPRAARYGLVCGVVLSAAPVVFLMLGGTGWSPYLMVPHAVNEHLSAYRLGLSELEVLTVVLIPGPLFGFAGGWVVDSGRFRRPTVAIVVALAIANFAYSAFFSALFRTWLPWSITYLYPLAAWWLAVWLHPEIDKLLTVQKLSAPAPGEPSAANSLASSQG